MTPEMEGSQLLVGQPSSSFETGSRLRLRGRTGETQGLGVHACWYVTTGVHACLYVTTQAYATLALEVLRIEHSGL